MSRKSGKSGPKDKEVATYHERDIVLGKVRGFPPWPGMVVDPDSVPPAVQQERPGKKSNFYCVQFFPAGDYAWLVPKDISKLQHVEIEAYINEPYKKGMKRKRESEGRTRKGPKEREREAKAKAAPKTPKAKTAPKAKTKQRKGKSAAMVESEDERRGDADDDADGEGEVVPHSNKAASPPPAKRQRREDDPDDSTMQGDPEAIKVRDWRHKLQKAFLSAKSTPDDSDMPTLDTLFTTVESYTTMTVAHLQFSKIGKVMRHITLLEDRRVPRDGEFRFRARAQALVERWQSVLGAAKEGKEGKREERRAEGGAVNGVEAVNGKDEEGVSPTAPASASAPKSDVNGVPDDDVDMTAHTDADAPGEADGEGDVSGQADAPGEAEDSAMAEAEAEAEAEGDADV
ncbi:Putative oxidoreductase GLYR1 like protein [Termitomyces sp. J132]|nr:Putative oxidoreductase GLYR1 like protein [Termitomyces sp. J132]